MPGDNLHSVVLSKIVLAANIIMLALFLFAVAVQYNDPDPIRWMAIYGAAAAACGLSLTKRKSRWFPAAVALIALLWAGTLAASDVGAPIGRLFESWEMKDANVEEAREMMGLFIVTAWMVVLSVRNGKSPQPTTEPAPR